MVGRTFLKTIRRCFFHNKGRFFANLFIVLISVCLSCGLISLPEIYEESYSSLFSKGKAPDIILKGKTEEGFSNEDIQYIRQDTDVESVLEMMAFDYQDDDGKIYRLYLFDFSIQECDLFSLEKGSFPEQEFDLNGINQVLAEQGNSNRIGYQVGDMVSLDLASFFLSSSDVSLPFQIPKIDFEVSGIVNTPLYSSTQEEEPWLEENPDEKKVSAIFYLDRRLLPDELVLNMHGFSFPPMKTSTFIRTTDVFILYQDSHDYFSFDYQKRMEEKKKSLSLRFDETKASILTLEENTSYATFKNYNNKVKKISYVFPVFFLLLSALVNLITMTRLVEDERKIVACYVSLGVSKTKIAMKYLLFTFLSTLFGLVPGYFIGVSLLPPVILPAYASVFRMDPIHIVFNQWLCFLIMSIMILVTLLVTGYAISSSLRETPSSLMKNKAPKPGKKILLEKIPAIWNPLPFKFKSSIRNIFRQKKNLILTSLAILGSTLLCLLGFGLLDISNSLLEDPLFSNVASSMGTISLVIILFALMMAVVVIYSLSNMNIQERVRELATLKVLGYHDIECSFYTFREMLMIVVSSCLLSLPVSYGIMYFVFAFLDFGSANDIRFLSYLYTFIIIVSASCLINFLLYPKVRHIDMNDSLKTLE